MSSLTMLPPSREVAFEEAKARSNYMDVLEASNLDVAHVYRAWHPIDSDRWMWVDGYRVQAACVIYLTSKDEPRTALIVGETVVTSKGWNGQPKEKKS